MTGARGLLSEELQAYVDGELEEARLAEIERLLEGDPGSAEKVALFRADKLRLAKIYGGLADRPLPQHWRQRIEEPLPARRPTNWRLAASSIAAAFVLLIGGAVLIRPLFAPQGDTIIEDAIAARQNDVSAKETITVGARSDGAADRVVASALDMRAKAPDLRKLGYELAAIKVYSQAQNRSAIELVYQGKNTAPLTLYVRHTAGAVTFYNFEKNGLRGCVWQDEIAGMVMMGKVSAAEMPRLASAVYMGLES